MSKESVNHYENNLNARGKCDNDGSLSGLSQGKKKAVQLGVSETDVEVEVEERAVKIQNSARSLLHKYPESSPHCTRS